MQKNGQLNQVKIKMFLIVSAILFAGVTIAQSRDTTKILLNEITVFADKIPMPIYETPRSVTIISHSDIVNSPALNVEDILGYFAGVDIRRRGQEGAQADVSMRGSSFEQTLILLDGVKLTDPQTGHHNLNLPINIDDIERIEIIKGQASGIYGANALGGVINIITKRDFKNEVSINLAGGENSYNTQALSAKVLGDKTENNFSASRSRSAGYRPNTDYNILTAYAGSRYKFEACKANINIGFAGKEFGANQFYGDKYPAQWEETKTFFISSNVSINTKYLTVSPTIYWRHNYDHYLLDYKDPSSYENIHRTNVYGLDLQSTINADIGDFLIAVEYSYDKLNSNKLGIHNRTKGGVSGEFVADILPGLKLMLSGYSHYYDSFGWKLAPGLDIGYQFTKSFRIFSSIGKSFRIPSFTELYYISPSQAGNAALHPEEAIAYELGFAGNVDYCQYQVSAFARKGTNFIDWVKQSAADIWNAKNISIITTKGFEAAIGYSSNVLNSNTVFKTLKLDYAYLYSDFQTYSFQSKYSLEHLRHQLILTALHSISNDIIASWAFKYLDRFNQETAFVTDVKMSKSWGFLTMNLAATNLFNISYREVGIIPMPGRWIKVEMNYTIR